MKTVLQYLLGILLLSRWEYSAQAQVTNVDTGESFTTIQAAIDDADTDDGDVIDLGTATYLPTTTVIINKSLTIRGNGGNTAIQPIVQGRGNTLTQAIFLIDAANIVIENIYFRVLRSEADTRHVIRATTSNNFDNLLIINNLIEVVDSTTSIALESSAIYLESLNSDDLVTIQGNTIRRETIGALNFGRGVRILGGSAIVGGATNAESNVINGTYAIQIGSAGTTSIQNNDLIGLTVLTAPQAIATIGIIDNSLNSGSNSIALEIKDNTYGGIVNIENNTLGGSYNIGVFITRSNNVTIHNNTFNTSTDPFPIHIILSTKQRTDADATTQTAFSTEAIITGNTFNGSPSTTSPLERGIALINHNDVCDFGEVQIGGSGVEANTFSSNLETYIELDSLTGSSATELFWSSFPAASHTTMTPVSQSFDATENLFDVTGSVTPLRYSAMNNAQRADLETKLVHRPDQAVLGRLLPADDASALMVNNLNITSATCQGDADGTVSGTIVGGDPAITGVYSVEVNTDPIQSVLTTDGSFTFTNLAQQSYTIALDDLNGNTATQNINVGAPFALSIFTSGDVTIVRSENTPLSAEAVGAVSYSWSPTGGLDNPDSATPIASPQETTTYTVTVSDGTCTYEESLTVTVIDAGRIALPNIFFPERTDTPNTTFVATGEGIESITLRIYNRLGQEVYRSSDWNEIQNAGWDGKVGGTIQNSEAYVWYIAGKFVDGRDLATSDGKQTGTVILMR